MIIHARTEQAVTISGSPRTRSLARSITRGDAPIVGVSVARDMRRGRPTRLLARVWQAIDGGTSLAPTIAACHRSVVRGAEVRDRSSRTRDKMLTTEIVFDIRRVVPEYVPPRCGVRGNEPGVRSHESTDSCSFDRSRHRAPRLSGLCQRGTHQ